jgi:hypothetical protein
MAAQRHQWSPIGSAGDSLPFSTATVPCIPTLHMACLQWIKQSSTFRGGLKAERELTWQHQGTDGVVQRNYDLAVVSQLHGCQLLHWAVPNAIGHAERCYFTSSLCRREDVSDSV